METREQVLDDADRCQSLGAEQVGGMTEKSAPATAYHEAGHAVVGEATGPGCVESLTIQVDNEEALKGAVTFSDLSEDLCEFIEFPWPNDPDILAELRECADAEIMRTLGGPLAEERFTGSWNQKGASSDLRDIFDLVVAAYPEDMDLTGGGWSLTCRFAPDMDLSVRKVRELWEDDTQNILTEHWSWVEAVAQAALDGDGNLTGDEIRSLRPADLARIVDGQHRSLRLGQLRERGVPARPRQVLSRAQRSGVMSQKVKGGRL